jgi:hypothetical protein
MPQKKPLQDAAISLYNSKRWEGIKKKEKGNIDGVNLVKVHYIHAINITMKLLCKITFNLC